MSDSAVERRWVVVRNAPGALRADVEIRQHRLVGDESEASGGADAGPSPFEYLLTALATCSAITMRLYATRKQWPLDEVIVRVRMARSQGGTSESGEPVAPGAQVIEHRIELLGNLSEEQRTKVLAIAARCPVTLALKQGIPVVGLANA